MLSEANIIARLRTDFPEYIGNDAAVIKQNSDESYVITKDILVEDIHFRLSYFDPLSLAHKALHVNLSDIAAMGAKPNFILLGLSIPTSRQVYIENFLTSFTKLCKETSTVLIGGDTTKSSDKVFISITAIGTVPSKHIKYRNTAKVNDLICVVGNLGPAYLGFIACEKFLAGFNDYKNAFLNPTAKTQEGIWLGSQTSVTSLMDISDGLFVDLNRLCKASNVRGNIDLDRVKPNEEFRNICKYLKIDPMQAIINGGEDYGLLFTVNVSDYVALNKGFMKKFGYAIKHIGSITEGDGVRFMLNGEQKNLTLKTKPFSHFGGAE